LLEKIIDRCRDAGQCHSAYRPEELLARRFLRSMTLLLTVILVARCLSSSTVS